MAKAGAKPVFEDSNVREVLKALGDASATGETRQMQAPLLPHAATGEQMQAAGRPWIALQHEQRAVAHQLGEHRNEILPLAKVEGLCQLREIHGRIKVHERRQPVADELIANQRLPRVGGGEDVDAAFDSLLEEG